MDRGSRREEHKNIEALEGKMIFQFRLMFLAMMCWSIQMPYGVVQHNVM